MIPKYDTTDFDIDVTAELTRQILRSKTGKTRATYNRHTNDLHQYPKGDTTENKILIGPFDFGLGM